MNEDRIKFADLKEGINRPYSDRDIEFAKLVLRHVEHRESTIKSAQLCNSATWQNAIATVCHPNDLIKYKEQGVNYRKQFIK